MDYAISLQVNGEPYDLSVSARRTLLDVLRFDLDLRGAHRGCDTGHCGICTVLLKRPSWDESPQPVVACLVLAVDVDGCEITTVEGLGRNGHLHPVQQSFIKYGGLQCGYCTSGMIMSAVALFERNQAPTEDEARQAIAGNMCRCTGYAKVVEAIMKAFAFHDDRAEGE